MSRLLSVRGLAALLLSFAVLYQPATGQERTRSIVRISPDGAIIGARSGGQLGVMIALGDAPAVAGVLIQEVVEGAPAEQAGLRAEDIVTHLNGVSLSVALIDAGAEEELDQSRALPPQRLIALLSETAPGDMVRIRYRRDDAEGEVTVVLSEFDDPFTALNLRTEFGPGMEFFADSLRSSMELLRDDGSTLRFRMDSLMPRILELREREGEGATLQLRMDSLMPRIRELVELQGDGSTLRLRMDSLTPRILELSELGGDRSTLRLRMDSLAPRLQEYRDVLSDQEGRYLTVISSLSMQGLQLHQPDEELGRYFGGSDGVLVLSATDDSTLGLQSGDVILAIGGRDVDGTGDVRRILTSYERGDSVELRIRRDGSERDVTGTIR